MNQIQASPVNIYKYHSWEVLHIYKTKNSRWNLPNKETGDSCWQTAQNAWWPGGGWKRGGEDSGEKEGRGREERMGGEGEAKEKR